MLLNCSSCEAIRLEGMDFFHCRSLWPMGEGARLRSLYQTGLGFEVLRGDVMLT